MASARTLLALFCACCVVLVTRAQRSRVACYDYEGRAQRCQPPFENAAFNKPVVSTDTCGGRGPEEYCVQLQTGRAPGARKSCYMCDQRNGSTIHPPTYLTDFHNIENVTWWQSSTMLSDIQYPHSVNLTLNFGKTFELTYVRLKFYSSRPESFSIYKKTSATSAWQPYQFYSASCESTYRLNRNEIISRDDEQKAVCVDQYSDISPLSGGNVPFSTLEGRPSAYSFDTSDVLQDWVTAAEIRIVLNRLNTYGDEVFGDPNVLRSYFYAISDFAVGGRCKCNGHASECRTRYNQQGDQHSECVCEHHTMGQDCDQCQVFYNDQPWQRATSADAHECQACNCNSLSERCFFDEQLYRQTGHGGHCLECRNNTAGPNCERCKDNYFRRRDQDRCEPCACDPQGSESTQCDMLGRCTCKRGVMGERCDRCMPNHYDFGNWGCRECGCAEAGSRGNSPTCETDSGQCDCKEKVEGLNCDRCKPGYFNLAAEDSVGCMACFCYGHSSVCSSAQGYTSRHVHTDFSSGAQRWLGENRKEEEVPIQYNGVTKNIGISAQTIDPVYFVSPARYHGNQRFAYNRYLTFDLRLGEDGARASSMDVILEGHGLRVSLPIYGQGNPVPNSRDQTFSFRLNEHESYGWKPTLTANDYISMLGNLTAIKIRGTYTPQGVGFLDSVKLDSARQGGSGDPVSSVEYCQCPEGYVGQFCESCAPGYRRDPIGGDAFAACVPCNCNGHSEACDVTSGRCICQHHTTGQNCERCEAGYYGYALAGTPDDCQRCPCPRGGECVEMLSGDVACINCEDGYTGNRCEYCSDGYYGDPNGLSGSSVSCRKCNCNDNVDYNAVGNCDRTTGECLKCVYNTAGLTCERCLPGYYGDALSEPRGQCQACACYQPGTLSVALQDGALSCDERSGQCPCQQRVIGKHCDGCEDGTWNINSGRGCDACNCDPTGSYNRTCDLTSGQCHCKPGVTGRKCDSCQADHWGYSRDGCKACQCNMEGASVTQCDLRTGQCVCFPSIEGEKCDRCVENKFNITAGCRDCPPCYGLVKDHVTILRHKINELREIIRNIGDNPQEVDDAEFRDKLAKVNASVNELWNDAVNSGGSGDSSLGQQLESVRQLVGELMSSCGTITVDITTSRTSSARGVADVARAEVILDEAESLLREAEASLITEGQKALQDALDELQDLDAKSEQLSAVAREARELAEQQEADATEIEATANMALNTSNEARRIATDVLRRPDDLKQQIEDLGNQVVSVEVEYETTRSEAERAETLATEVKSESLTIFSDVKTLVVPDIDTGKLYEQAKQITDDAAQIKREAEELMAEHAELMVEVETEKEDAMVKLDMGYEQQAITDELLADADRAKAIAEEAVATAERTLDDANTTYYTLLDFHRNVAESEDRARQAQRLIPEIQDRISEAETKTAAANVNLEDAVREAEAAKEIALKAESTAETASRVASDIKLQAETLKDTADNLNYEAEDLDAKAEAARRRLEAYEGQADSDSQRVDDALRKAHEAQQRAKESSEKVDDALHKVTHILTILERITLIDSGRLDELELSLAEARAELEAANINARYSLLEYSLSQQERWVGGDGTFLVQLALLKQDVDNIRVINETIPRTCFKQIELEPTLPPAINTR